MIGLMHGAQIGHVVQPLRPIGKVEQSSHQPASGWHLYEDEPTGREPAERTLKRGGRIFKVLKYGTERHQIESTRLIFGILDGGQLQSIRFDSSFDRSVAKVRGWLEAPRFEALVSQASHRLTQT